MVMVRMREIEEGMTRCELGQCRGRDRGLDCSKK